MLFAFQSAGHTYSSYMGAFLEEYLVPFSWVNQPPSGIFLDISCCLLNSSSQNTTFIKELLDSAQNNENVYSQRNFIKLYLQEFALSHFIMEDP